MDINLSSLEKRVLNLEKLKQIANYRYAKGQTTDLKEIIDLEKLSLSIDRQELINSKKREVIFMEAITDIMKLNNNIETITRVQTMVADIVLETGVDPKVFENYLIENE